jgi:hypothetical protein
VDYIERGRERHELVGVYYDSSLSLKLLYVHHDLLEGTALLDCVFVCVFVVVSTVQPMCVCV